MEQMNRRHDRSAKRLSAASKLEKLPGLEAENAELRRKSAYNEGVAIAAREKSDDAQKQLSEMREKVFRLESELKKKERGY
jgi:hypothetical protein